MLKRLSLGLIVAFGAMSLSIPLPATGTDVQPAGRVLIDAPDPQLAELMVPAQPSSATAKPAGPFFGTASANHVNKLPADAVQKLKGQGIKVLTNRDGEVQLQGQFEGEERTVAIIDAVLPSGREVVGFGAVRAPPKPEALPFVKAAEATTVFFAICSYAWMNWSGGDLYVHLCPVDAAFSLAILTVAAAAIGGLVGAFMGGPVGAAVGVAIGTLLSFLAIGYFWSHSDWQGNVDLLIPNYTMQSPYGGWMYWYYPGRWDWMDDECLITEDGITHRPYCA